MDPLKAPALQRQSWPLPQEGALSEPLAAPIGEPKFDPEGVANQRPPIGDLREGWEESKLALIFPDIKGKTHKQIVDNIWA